MLAKASNVKLGFPERTCNIDVGVVVPIPTLPLESIRSCSSLPVLMEKLNYLVGLCYPAYTVSSLMVSPFIELTIGDMFNGTPGILSGLTVTVEDATTWEIENGLQFPHFISCQCEFKYIGGDENVPVLAGKHYDISWLKGNHFGIGDEEGPTGIYPRNQQFVSDTSKPLRKAFKYIDIIDNAGPIIDEGTPASEGEPIIEDPIIFG